MMVSWKMTANETRKVGVMVAVRFVGTSMMIDFLTKALDEGSFLDSSNLVLKSHVCMHIQ